MFTFPQYNNTTQLHNLHNAGLQEDSNVESSNAMQSEESQCLAAMKSKWMCENSKSKRKTFIGELRKRMCNEPTTTEEVEQQQTLFASDSGCPSRDQGNLKHTNNNNNHIFSNTLNKTNTNDANNSQSLQFPLSSSSIDAQWTSSKLVGLVQSVYQTSSKLSYKDAKDLKMELQILRRKTADSSFITQIIEQQSHSQLQQPIQNPQPLSVDLHAILECLLFVMSENQKISMDVIYEAVSVLANISACHSLPQQLLQLFVTNNKTISNFEIASQQLVNLRQATVLLTKAVLLIGNLALESQEFAASVVANYNTHNPSNLDMMSVIQSTVLYFPDGPLVAETIWMLGVLYKSTQFHYATANFNRNICYVLYRFKGNPRVAQELLWYLIQMSSDGDNQLHELYFDQNVLTRLLGLLLSSQHSGNIIATLSLLSNAIAMLSQDQLAFFTTLQAVHNNNTHKVDNHSHRTQHNNSNLDHETHLNNNNISTTVASENSSLLDDEGDIVLVQANDPCGKNALLLAVSNFLQSPIVQVQRECLVFLSNLAVIFPLFLVQTPQLIDLLISLFQSGRQELFIDMTYFFSNLLLQLQQPQLLAQQHPQLPVLLQAILENENIQATYGTSALSSAFQHFAAYLASL